MLLLIPFIPFKPLAWETQCATSCAGKSQLEPCRDPCLISHTEYFVHPVTCQDPSLSPSPVPPQGVYSAIVEVRNKEQDKWWKRRSTNHQTNLGQKKEGSLLDWAARVGIWLKSQRTSWMSTYWGRHLDEEMVYISKDMMLKNNLCVWAKAQTNFNLGWNYAEWEQARSEKKAEARLWKTLKANWGPLTLHLRQQGAIGSSLMGRNTIRALLE